MTYDQSWHARFASESRSAAEKVLSYVADIYHPASLLDLGAGAGWWVECATRLGVSDCVAIDGGWTDPNVIVVDRARYLTHDLGEVIDLGRKFDVAICLEVAQYLDEIASQKLLETLTLHSDVILFSSAVPFQGGDNRTERWQSYWADRFDQLGYEAFDIIRPRFWRDKSIAYYYRQNTLVYVRRSADGPVRLSEDVLAGSGFNRPLDVVHPEKWELTLATSRRARLRRLVDLRQIVPTLQSFATRHLGRSSPR